jgi:hypothetical protein
MSPTFFLPVREAMTSDPEGFRGSPPVQEVIDRGEGAEKPVPWPGSATIVVLGSRRWKGAGMPTLSTSLMSQTCPFGG